MYGKLERYMPTETKAVKHRPTMESMIREMAVLYNSDFAA
jgi:hypothetical protein